jgi:hypothetical protein
MTSAEKLLSIYYSDPTGWHCTLCHRKVQHPPEGLTKAATDHLRECREEKATS